MQTYGIGLHRSVEYSKNLTIKGGLEGFLDLQLLSLRDFSDREIGVTRDLSRR
jgi:hypothetical protein